MQHKAVYLLFCKITLHVSGVNHTYHQGHGSYLFSSSGHLPFEQVMSVTFWIGRVCCLLKCSWQLRVQQLMAVTYCIGHGTYLLSSSWQVTVEKVVVVSCGAAHGNFFFLWRCGPTQTMASSFLRFLDHTQRRITVGRLLCTSDQLVVETSTWLTHNTHNRRTPMNLVGFEPTISAGERPETYDLDRLATGTGRYGTYDTKFT